MLNEQGIYEIQVHEEPPAGVPRRSRVNLDPAESDLSAIDRA